jgi:outer membrane protein assembly factor BamB
MWNRVRKRLLAILIALTVLVTGCTIVVPQREESSGEEATYGPSVKPPKAPKIASIDISPASAILEAGGPPTRLTASTFDAQGNELFNSAVKWSCSPAKAIILEDLGFDPNGRPIADIRGDPSVTTSTAGTVQARAGGVSATINVQVDPTPTVQALWARTISEGGILSWYYSLTADASGDVYAAGGMQGGASYGFGNGVTAAGTSTSYNVLLVKYDASGTAQWARTLTEGTGRSWFRSVAVDGAGNVYAAGHMEGSGTYGFGNGVSAAGTCSSWSNALLVKYDSTGTAQWARTVVVGDDLSEFWGLAVDGAGNVYVSGRIRGIGTYGFGDGVSVAGTYSDGINAVLVKYDGSGAAQWARTVTQGTSYSWFTSLAADSDGNTYAAGGTEGTGSYGFGGGVTITGTSYYNLALVKYDTSGTAQWARTFTQGSGVSWFSSVAVDNASSVYVSGYMNGTDAYGFGNQVTATGVSENQNAVLVKYNVSGTAQWAQSITQGTEGCTFDSVAVDSSGNVYVAGSLRGSGEYGFGAGVTAAGTYPGGFNLVLLRYSAIGTARWARTVTQGDGPSAFYAVLAGSSPEIYAGGYVGTGTYGFGDGVTATGTSSGDGVALVKYGY